MQPSSEAYEIEDRCFSCLSCQKIDAPAPRCCQPCRRGYSFAPTRVRQVLICNKPLDPKQHHCYGCRYGGGVDRRHAALARCHCGYHSIAQWGQSISLKKRYLPLLVLSMDRLNTLGWILSSTLTVQSRSWTSLSLLPSLAIRPWCLLPAQKTRIYGQESGEDQIRQVPTHQPGPVHPGDNRPTWTTCQEIH